MVRSVSKGPGLNCDRTVGVGSIFPLVMGCLLKDLSLDGFREQGRAGPKAEIGDFRVLRGVEDHLPHRRISREAESTLWVV